MRQLREERRANVQARIEAVNAELRKQEAAMTGRGADEDSASDNDSAEEQTENGQEKLDHEEAYADDDRFTTVTIEMVDVTRDGLAKPIRDGESEEDSDDAETKKVSARGSRGTRQAVEPKRPKKKKKKFRYESKAERRQARDKVKARNEKEKARRLESK